MNADPEYRRFQFGIADLLAVMAVVAVLGSLSSLPASLFHAIPLFAVLYLAKFRILRLRVRPWVGVLLYLLVVAALLPYDHCRFIVDGYWWGYISPLTCWIGGTIIAFAVPTASFLYDVLARTRLSARLYALRSLVEVVIFVPLWAFVWLLIEMWFLHWIWHRID